MAIKDHHSAPIMVATKNSYQNLNHLSNIPNDAELQGLSENIKFILGQNHLVSLQSKY